MAFEVQNIVQASLEPSIAPRRTQSQRECNAHLSISYPLKTHIKTAKVIQPLRWFNTHYKKPHVFNGGRIEIVFERALRNFPRLQEEENDRAEKAQEKPHDKHLSFKCPYCQKLLWFYVNHINEQNGHLQCRYPRCKKEFGVHPSGQIYVVRDALAKEPMKVVDKDRLMKWLRYEAHYGDWAIEENQAKDGVTVQVSAPNEEKLEEIVDDLKSELDHRGLKFQEGE